MIMSVGFGAVSVGVITAANAGVPADEAGLAASLINTSQQLGAAVGLAIFSAIASARTNELLHATPRPDRLQALTLGYRDALLVCAAFVLAVAATALIAPNSRGEAQQPSQTRCSRTRLNAIPNNHARASAHEGSE